MTAPLESITIEPDHVEEPTQDEINRKSWKYSGYKRFASWVASDSDFFAARRFGLLHTRAILTLQGHLVGLEELFDMDNRYSSKYTKIIGDSDPEVVDVCPSATKSLERFSADPSLRDINNGSVRNNMPAWELLLADITAKLKEYHKVLLNYSSLHSLPPAPTRNVKNIHNWFGNNPGAIVDAETQFVNHREELVSFSRQKSLLRQWFETHVLCRTWSTFGLFHKAPSIYLGCRDDDQDRFLFSDEAVDAASSVATFFVADTMLIMPLWILQTLQDMGRKLAIITVFVVVCLGFLSLATIGRPFERLAATAGYAAVLVVFLEFGNTN